ncbi:hypothetical protein P154DRAFT_481232 [Amniculicola lignicola CBS 123094]|uniref:Uncharacterized protein n=1 Tax=Amniculicola lignicola CBS 123094 TaxID=1392246 RepID=A0A6A5X244_9PLEO|nr:hypothetical protein P154DRAFT_481232 [Amniculicola lignicola CBS 123094]
MHLPLLFSILLFLSTTLASALPTPTGLARRKEDIHLPTFTLGPLDQYVSHTASVPTPSGDSLQIYPTGILERAPLDGIDVVFGPDLRKRISAAVEGNCKDDNTEKCRNAIIPVVQSTDVSHHSKRFLFMLIGAGLALLVAELITIYVMSKTIEGQAPPDAVHFTPSDLHQIEALGNANTVAIEAYVAESTSIATITVTPTPTPTANAFITIETLTADQGDHKQGDVVYRVPQKLEQRLHDLLGILGSDENAQKCAGQRKRADVTEACARAIRNTAEALFNAAPEGALAVAQQNLPRRPAPGGALRLPVQNFVLVEVPIVVILAHRVVPMQVIEEFDALGLAQASLAVTLAAHALMFAGSTLLEIWIPKDQLASELKEEDFACPKDLICIDESCGAQEENKRIAHRDAVCKEGTKYAACKCKRVNYP